jgi:hypothetical protein
VVVHDVREVLPALKAGYDLVFFDGPSPVPELHARMHRLLRLRGPALTSAACDKGACARPRRWLRRLENSSEPRLRAALAGLLRLLTGLLAAALLLSRILLAGALLVDFSARLVFRLHAQYPLP